MSKLQFFDIKQKFSIRKYSVGVISVLVGMALFGSGQPIFADELIRPTVQESTTVTVSEPQIVGESVNKTIGELSTSKEVQVGDSISTSALASSDIDNSSALTESLGKEVSEVNESQLSISSKEVSAIERQSDFALDDSSISNTYEGNVEEKLTTVEGNTNFGVENIIESPDNTETASSKHSFSSISPVISTRSVVERSVVGNDYPYQGITTGYDKYGYAYSQCTSFVAWKVASNTNFKNISGLGNAGNWGYELAKRGAVVNSTPAVGTIAWAKPYSTYGPTQYGHVAWVTGVNSDGTVSVEEYNWLKADGSFDYAHHQNTYVVSKLSGFIHLPGGVVDGNTNTEQPPIDNNAILSSGTYTFTSRIGIKSEPKISSPDIAYYDVGMSVNYDSTLSADGYKWISYISYGGNRRYIAIKKLSTTTPTITNRADIAVQNVNNVVGTYDVVITGIQSTNGIKAIKVPTWSDLNSQDDIVWYNAVRQSDGSYRLTINIANHKGNQGQYHSHVYLEQNDGKLVGLGAIDNIYVTKAVPVSPNLPSSGSYTFTTRSAIRGAASLSSPVIAYYNPGMSVNYDKILMSEGKSWISYISYGGNRRYVAIS